MRHTYTIYDLILVVNKTAQFLDVNKDIHEKHEQRFNELRIIESQINNLRQKMA